MFIETLRYEEAARAKMIEWLAESPDYLLYNLSTTNLGLDAAIRVIVELVEKRVNLGDFEETAWRMAREFFGSFLESCGPDSPADFALWMVQTAMPLIERPDGTVMHNANACEIWRDGNLHPIG
jgi:hypothetical protein